MNKKQKGGVKNPYKNVKEEKIDTVKDGYRVKKRVKSRRRGKITKLKTDERLLAGEIIGGAPGRPERLPDPPSKGGLIRKRTKLKLKDGKLKKSRTQVLDKEGKRSTKTVVRKTRKGVTKKKVVIWENGKRKVIKTRDGVVTKKKGYQTGGFLESPIEEI
jgi:RNA recognition motif-containing protein